ncbi:MAG: 30S ribosomal protein S7 [Candidatus Woesearchaeota archaeon]|jgi:small subunit ribosomal protein S7
MEIKVFNQWSVQGIVVNDLGLQPYISLRPVFAPKTGARYAGNKFHKSKINIVERLVNKLMIPGHKGKKHFKSSGHITGKASGAYEMVSQCFEIIAQRTNKNPIEVYVKAIENAAPREEIITIEYGGARYPKAVECAPQRRIDLALRYFVQGSFQKAFNNKKPFVQFLADEIIAAFQSSSTSIAIAKKNELERQADSSR